MIVRASLLALFVLVLALGSVWHGIQAGHLLENFPEIAVHLSLAGFLGWRAWKIANDGKYAEYQAKTTSLRWQEATSAALMVFCSCVVLFVPLAAISSLHPETFHHIDPEAMLAVMFVIASAGAVLMGICRFFWWR